MITRPVIKTAAVVRFQAALLAAALFFPSCVAVKKSRIFPAGTAGKPYIRQYGQVDGFTVWVVNGQYVRENLDEEFTNFGQHFRFRFIPAREFWLDQENVPGEDGYFVHHLLTEYRLTSQGMDYDRALERADAAEKAEREEAAATREGQALMKSGHVPELVERIHKQWLDGYGERVKVWVVSGELVRSILFIDFTEGGHHNVYSFVPEGEVWIDDDVTPAEREFILLHEMHERRLMSEGWNYNRAHRDSSRVEFYCRRHPLELNRRLKQEIEANSTAVPAAKYPTRP